MTWATSRSRGTVPATSRGSTAVLPTGPESARRGEPMSRPTVVLVGTLDTKGEEYAYLRERLEQAGVATLLVDVGTQGSPRARPDVSRESVAAAGGFELASLTDRGEAVQAMCAAAPRVVRRLFEEGRCQGVLAAGGSGNTAIATAAMRALPVG